MRTVLHVVVCRQEYGLRPLPTHDYPDKTDGVTLTCTKLQEAVCFSFDMSHNKKYSTLSIYFYCRAMLLLIMFALYRPHSVISRQVLWHSISSELLFNGCLYTVCMVGLTTICESYSDLGALVAWDVAGVILFVVHVSPNFCCVELEYPTFRFGPFGIVGSGLLTSPHRRPFYTHA